jgi:adenylate cyclase
MKRNLVIVVLGLLVTLLCLMFTWNEVFQAHSVLPRLNNIVYDVTYKLFHSKAKSDAIVIVDIDEKSLIREGKWPWSRDKVAALVSNLQHAGAAVIAFDILFAENDFNPAKIILDAQKQHELSLPVTQYLSTNLPTYDNDRILAQTLAKSDIVLGMFFSNDLYQSIGKLGKPFLFSGATDKLIIPRMLRYTSSIEPLVDAAKLTGAVTIIPDVDGVVRYYPMLINYENGLYAALALQAVNLYWLDSKVELDWRMLDQKQILLGIKVGQVYIPTDATGSILIPYIGPAFSFPYVSATQILHNEFNVQDVAGKLIFIGSSAVGIADMHTVPLQSASYPGVEVHASVANAILNNTFISSPAWMVGFERLLIVGLGIIFIILALRSSMLGLVLLIILAEGFVFALQAEFWLKGHWVLPHEILPYLQIIILGILNLGYGYFFEARTRKKLHDIYGQYVSNAHIDEMLNHPTQYTMSGRSKEMTVLFADIRNFTAISEKLDSNQVKNFLNAIFTPLTEIVFSQKGTIDKYVGDMLMAFWNDPTDDNDHALHAVQSGLMMIAKVKSMFNEFASFGLTNVRIGVGINTGIMHVGDMGSKFRKAYTVLGDAVNLASRLESANKFYGTSILVSADAKNKCHGITFRFIDRVCVKGKEVPIEVYEPIGFENQISSAMQVYLDQHQLALDAYYARQWDIAKKQLSDLKAQKLNEVIYDLYLTRIEKFSSPTVCEVWDGTHKLGEK